MRLFAPAATDEQIKRKKIRDYYMPPTGLGPMAYSAMGFALLCLFALLIWLGAMTVILAIVAIAATVPFAIAWVIFNERGQGASDEDIDYWRDEDFDGVIARVCEEAGYDSADLINPGDPIVIIGFPRFENLRVRHARDDGSAAKSWRFKVRVGEDGATRFTPPSLTVLHFTKDHLIAYQCDLDLVRGDVLNESVSEYFWQDIVSLQIDKQSVSWADEDEALVRQWARALPPERKEKYAALWAEGASLPAPSDRRTTLRLKTNTGTGLEIVIGDERFAEYEDDGGLAGSIGWRNNEAIARLRKLLRDRKSGRK